MKNLTFDAWYGTYMPLPNYNRNDGELEYKTSGKDLKYVSEVESKHVWTQIRDESGNRIVPGLISVNAIYHYITTTPWNDAVEVDLE